MKIYRIRNLQNEYISRSGYETDRIERARIWTRLGDVKQVFSRMKDGYNYSHRKIQDWYVEEYETSEVLVSTKPGNDVIAESERKKAEREAANQRAWREREKEERRKKFEELQKEFGN